MFLAHTAEKVISPLLSSSLEELVINSLVSSVEYTSKFLIFYQSLFNNDVAWLAVSPRIFWKIIPTSLCGKPASAAILKNQGLIESYHVFKVFIFLALPKTEQYY